MPKQTFPPGELQSILEKLPPGSTIQVSKSPAGDIIVTSDGQAKTKRQLLQENFPHLVGQGISLSQAAKKYGVSRSVISQWVYRQDYVHFVDQDSYPQLVDEAEVALCVQIYRQRQETGLTGVPYFDEHNRLIEEVLHPHRSKRHNK